MYYSHSEGKTIRALARTAVLQYREEGLAILLRFLYLLKCICILYLCLCICVCVCAFAHVPFFAFACSAVLHYREAGLEVLFLRGPLMIIWLWLMVTDGFQGTSFLTQSDRRPIIKWAFLLDSETKALLAVWTEVVDGGQGMPWFIVVWAGRTIFHSNMISRVGICLWKTRKCVEFKL